MPSNRGQLIRISAIDRCLRNRYRKWTRDALIDACSEALAEYEGRYRRVSRRTFQNDLALMRSERLGYNAPIIVRDKIYYEYEDPDYTITHLPLNDDGIKAINSALEVLRNLQGFPQLETSMALLTKLNENITTSGTPRRRAIDMDHTEDYAGERHIGALYDAVVHRTTMLLEYRPFSDKDETQYPYRMVYPLLLKEYRNRWFLLARISGNGNNRVDIYALDRIRTLKRLPEEPFKDIEGFDPESYFSETIGVSRKPGSRAERVEIAVSGKMLPYLETKPIHKSQRVELRRADGSGVIKLRVIVNKELERILLGYGADVQVLAPAELRERMAGILQKASEAYRGGS